MELLKEYISVEGAFDIISFDAFLYLFLVLALIWFGKQCNNLVSKYSLDEELTHKDNKALAVSYAGYLIGQGIIVLGLFRGQEASTLVEDLGGIAVWSVIGIVLLNIARVINDKLLFSKFDNTKEIITDRNVGTGAVQFGSYVGTAFLINGVVSGESDGMLNDIIGTIIFFIIGQLGFIIFGKVYEKVVSYDLHDEIEKDNEAAGISFGLTLVAIGIIMSFSIYRTASIPAFLIWFVNGTALIIITRFIVDKLILPKHKLEDEIAQDRNWGVALIEGGTAVIMALLINASFA